VSETVTQPVWETTLPGSIDALIHGFDCRVEPEGLRRLLNARYRRKRMRPLSRLLPVRRPGKRADTIVAGAALELLHSSSLVHDDIMDKAELRTRHADHRPW